MKLENKPIFGGGMTATLLWANPNPNSSIGLTGTWNDRNIPIKIYGIKGNINGI